MKDLEFASSVMAHSAKEPAVATFVVWIGLSHTASSVQTLAREFDRISELGIFRRSTAQASLEMLLREQLPEGALGNIELKKAVAAITYGFRIDRAIWRGFFMKISERIEAEA